MGRRSSGDSCLRRHYNISRLLTHSNSEQQFAGYSGGCLEGDILLRLLVRCGEAGCPWLSILYAMDAM
jgi:hypothetical protein